MTEFVGGGLAEQLARQREREDAVTEALRRTWPTTSATIAALRSDGAPLPADAARLEPDLDYLVELSAWFLSRRERRPLAQLRRAVRAFHRHARRRRVCDAERALDTVRSLLPEVADLLLIDHRTKRPWEDLVAGGNEGPDPDPIAAGSRAHGSGEQVVIPGA